MDRVNVEREFKFLIKTLPSNLPEPLHIDQYYFKNEELKHIFKKMFSLDNLDAITTYRVRKITYLDETKYVLTLKTSGKMSRLEYENEIDQTLFNKIISGHIDSLIIKNRYIDRIGEYIFEFDEYFNLNEKMYTVEIELTDDNFDQRYKEICQLLDSHYHVLYENVTNDARYKNSNLIKYFGGKGND